MLQLEPKQMEALRQGTRALFPERIIEELRRQGRSVERDAASGDVVVSEAGGARTRLAFRSDGLPTRLVSPSGDTFCFEHDSGGRLAALIFPWGQRLDLQHDLRGNLLSLRQPAGVEHRFEYDKENRLLAVVYPDGSRTRMDYHSLGLVARVENRLGAVTRYERDASGRLLSRVDSLGRQTRYEADEHGRLAAVTFADGSRQSFTHDARSHTTTTVLRDGKPVVHTRDAGGIRHVLTWTDGTLTQLELEADRVKVASNAWGRVQFTLDDAGNSVAEETPWGRVRSEYDAQGRLVRREMPHGAILTYAYDEDGRVCSLKDWEGRETRVVYGPGGHVAELRYGNGLVETQKHAIAGRQSHACVRDPSLRLVSEQRYEYDTCERLVVLEDVWGEAADQRRSSGFRYDYEGHLQAEWNKGTDQALHAWEYDAEGNLIREDGISIRVGLLDEPRTWGAEPLGYDGNGNAVRLPSPRGELLCDWGGEGLLRETQVGGRTVRYEYDALGRRVLKTDGRTTWRYGWAEHQLLWEEFEQEPGAEPVRREYLFFPGTMVPLAFREQGCTYWLQTDTRGAVTRAFDEAGQVVWRARYDAFGHAHIEVEKVRQPWRLAGQFEDEETGLHYSLARYYCPWLKSYLSRDPRWYESEATSYSYARNDPWNRADPSGGLAPLLAVGIAGLVGGVVGAITAAVTGGDPLAGAAEGAIAGAGAMVAVVAGATAGVILAAGVVASGVGAFVGQLTEQARNGDGFCLECALKGALVAAGLDLALLGLGRIPGVKSLVKALGARLAGAGMKLAQKFKPLLRNALGKARALAEKARNLIKKAKCTPTGHPVDVATGRVFTEAVDWELPGVLPLRFERDYSSHRCDRDSVLGHGWSHSLDLALWEQPGQVVFRAEDGRHLVFDVEHLPDQTLAPGQEVWDPVERLTVRHLSAQRWEVESAEGLLHELGVVGAAGRSSACRVIRTADRAGHRIFYDYDSHARLRWVRDSAGRRILFEHDERGRLARVALPHAREDGWITYARYKYSENGDLIAVEDALGHMTRYEYRGHLLTRETDRVGLSFHFEYDGEGAEAWCTHTWGDRNLYTRKITYDKNARKTAVTNSLGHTTHYFSNEWGAVVKQVDALGGERIHEFDEFMNPIAESDPLGHVTRYEYDARGNCTRVIAPDGAAVTVSYNAFNLPEQATDALGGKWWWRYDSAGLLVEELNPLEERRKYEYAQGLLKALVDPLGQRTELGYDGDKNLSSIRYSNGVHVRLRYDRMGHLVEEKDAAGASWRLVYDTLGRQIRLEEPTGEIWHRHYDAVGNLKQIQGPLRCVLFTHSGFHKMAGWEEDGARALFHHDSEDQLLEITNEGGETLRLDRDAVGRVVREQGFDGALKKYQYDLAGRLVRRIHASERIDEFSYDAAGRLIGVKHSDGGFSRYVYRADGVLVEAENETGTVLLERDALGRIVAERQGEAQVASTYSLAGQRVELSSSLGLRQKVIRDDLGEVIRFECTSKERSAPWSVLFKRDGEGREVSRQMPGGVAARWSYDEAGRSLERRIFLRGEEITKRIVRWRGEDQIASIVDGVWGPVEFLHDGRGRLVGAKRPEGALQRRATDIVGNLFQKSDLSDRRYGRGGVLLESDGTQFRHDADGYLIEKREPGDLIWRYAWNGAGLLQEVQRPDGARVRFAYDAFCRRVSKSVVRLDSQGAEHVEHHTRFVWDGQVPLHEISNAAGTTHWFFEPENFVALGKEDSRGRYAVVSDHLGVPTEAYDELGRLAWRMQLDIHGVATTRGDRTPCPWRWPGQYEDEETGLYYNLHRYYDPTTGRYISQDPIRLAGGLGFYSYVSDPLSWLDPWGLQGIINRGGAFKDLDALKQPGEVAHHMPQNAFMRQQGVSRGDGPALGMEQIDHEKTRTMRWKGAESMKADAGKSARSRLAMDVKDIRKNFGNKYNKGMLEAIKYAKTLPEFKKPCP
ncbi:RHS repeat-associated core domain-containing protein [Hyalangium versicolor]|uniref:RHS repeat-associated core domain-containing protein n=1 Tax=Hyalangium versicolor TaxID=2861190 RepID=UPI00272AA20C|nr:RHS repeat-associated core domain-containing protein [Hyalangium versicolor]